jgi:hypothetical protein
MTVRLPDDAADYLTGLAGDTGLSVNKLLGMIVASAAHSGWTVRVTSVTPPGADTQVHTYGGNEQ